MKLRTLLAVVALVAGVSSDARADHWAFEQLKRPQTPQVKQAERVQTPVDAFLLATLEKRGLALNPAADRDTLLRRLSFGLIGLPPSAEEIARFRADQSPHSVRHAIDRLLASPHYGERWGKYWLDVAGYADSNGYFNADSDRPLAFRYRDYVIRSINADKPFDQFVREQLAGDELAAPAEGKPFTAEMAEMLTATHYLRNSQDGTSESDGNPDERTVDRATVLQGTLQIVANSLLGMTVQCARCHDHKFEPIEQADYYGLQAVFYPAFPAYHGEKWIKPKDRIGNIALPSEVAAWESRNKQLAERQVSVQHNFRAWIAKHRPPEADLFRDEFATPTLAGAWSNAAPGDDAAAGSVSVKVDASAAPAAAIANGALQIIESGGAGDRWLCTKKSFDWTPDREGEWIEASFDLVADKIGAGKTAERIAFFIATHDFNDNGPTRGGNVLIDANPAGGAAVHLDYPGDDSQLLGTIGTAGFHPGQRVGVRVTNVEGKLRLQLTIDDLLEKPPLVLSASDLPDGAFGFEYCCGRSFVVDRVVVESSGGNSDYGRQRKLREKELRKTLAEIDAARVAKPGSVAWVTDVVPKAPPVHLLTRGDFHQPAAIVPPRGLSALCDGNTSAPFVKALASDKTSGRRLAFANWLTDPKSRASALFARVTVNRIWQRHFGRGIVSTPDNFGLAGATPSHHELLEYLAEEFRGSGWSMKHVHRLILQSAAYQQSGAAREAALAADPDDVLLWRYPLQRLDAEAVRDAMLAASGELDETLYGPYVPTTRQDDGSVVVQEDSAGAARRGVYLQQRRTQMPSFLELFDAPVMVSNCALRGVSTVPLQSLALMNSTFVRERAVALARRAGGVPREQVPKWSARRAFGREPTEAERTASQRFLVEQMKLYQSGKSPEAEALRDYCQMIFASNAFLYVE